MRIRSVVFPLIAALLLSAAASGADQQLARNKAVAQRVFTEIFNQGKFEVVDEIYAKDFVNHGMTRDIGLKEDQEAARGWRQAAPDLVMTVDKLVAEGDLVTVLWTGSGTNTGIGNGLPATGRSEPAFQVVQDAEKQLDVLDREVDSSAAAAIALATPVQANEILICAKIIVDLERIGDLTLSVAGCARALGLRLKMDDISDLVKMASVVERMLINAQRAFSAREVEAAIAVLRADSDVDRLRNLMMIRHLEDAPNRLTQDSVQILFMAQSLERAVTT